MEKEIRWLEISVLLQNFDMLFRYYMTSEPKINRPAFCMHYRENLYYLQN
jgi:hypothetical protein